MTPFAPHLSPEVAEALAGGRPVVALETTIVVHGLPAPQNLEVAAECEAAVREAGAVPATVGVLDGRLVVGLSPEEVARLADPARRARKLSARDLGPALARGVDGATTVAGTIAAATEAGVNVMATGGLGGVHRGAAQSFDESADLVALARRPALVVASGVKSILDIPATLERLDTLGVPVVGYRTDHFPGFYLESSGEPLEWRVDEPAEAAATFAAHRALGGAGMLLAHPVPAGQGLDPALHERALAAALARAEREGVTGKAVTPVLLEEFARQSAGASVVANRALVVANARLAGAVAVALGAHG